MFATESSGNEHEEDQTNSLADSSGKSSCSLTTISSSSIQNFNLMPDFQTSQLLDCHVVVTNLFVWQFFWFHWTDVSGALVRWWKFVELPLSLHFNATTLWVVSLTLWRVTLRPVEKCSEGHCGLVEPRTWRQEQDTVCLSHWIPLHMCRQQWSCVLILDSGNCDRDDLRIYTDDVVL